MTFAGRRNLFRWPLPEQFRIDDRLDLLILVDPARFGEGIEGAVDRCVALTRTTQRLVILGSTTGGDGGVVGPAA
ncbi:hypothetical protein [Actinoplanes sp. NPDC020271]|uniref:hypothetical protein n=1 Tax=Actinoplanes sp. NPDC020271 TaxID=3363896 RepID=UPI0037BAB1DC